jgi:hypothetical protein
MVCHFSPDTRPNKRTLRSGPLLPQSLNGTLQRLQLSQSISGDTNWLPASTAVTRFGPLKIRNARMRRVAAFRTPDGQRSALVPSSFDHK